MKSLSQFIAAQKRRAFCYGVFDCCTFVADCVRAQTGLDPMAELRGTYSHRSQMRLLERLGGLSGAVRHYLNAREIQVRSALDGDVALVPATNGRTALGVFCGGLAYSPCSNGLQSFPASAVVRAWRAL